MSLISVLVVFDLSVEREDCRCWFFGNSSTSSRGCLLSLPVYSFYFILLLFSPCTLMGFPFESVLVTVSLHSWEMSAGLVLWDGSQSLGLNHLHMLKTPESPSSPRSHFLIWPAGFANLTQVQLITFPPGACAVSAPRHHYLLHLPHTQPLIKSVCYLKLSFFVSQSRFYHYCSRYLRNFLVFLMIPTFLQCSPLFILPSEWRS